MGARAYSSESPKPSQGSGGLVVSAILVAAAAGGAYYLSDDIKSFLAGGGAAGSSSTLSSKADANKIPTKEDYQKVYNRIAELFEKDPEYDAGSYAPVVVRLAWHTSGTYDKDSNTGGSNGATMRFPQEAGYEANAGLEHARKFHEPIKAEFPWITYSDLWTLGGVCGIQEMGGPTIPWRPGRDDHPAEDTPPDGRLPDGSQGQDHLRNIFHRMGYNDQEIVALSGAHALGQCHRHRSGFDGPWTFSQTTFSNSFFTGLLDMKWNPKKWDGPFQYADETDELMMLPTDYSLVKDATFKKWVKKYAEDESLFFKDFAKVFTRLLELGVPEENFKNSARTLGTDKPLEFVRTFDQEDKKEDKKEDK